MAAVVAVNMTLKEYCLTEFSYLLVFVQFDGNMEQALASLKWLIRLLRAVQRR